MFHEQASPVRNENTAQFWYIESENPPKYIFMKEFARVAMYQIVDPKTTMKFYLSIAVLIALLVASSSGDADNLDQAIVTENTINQAAISSQKKIDRVSSQTREALDEFRRVTRETDTLMTYNGHLKKMLQSQQDEKASIERQLVAIETTGREIIPLILRMLESIESFVELDFPFLPEERHQRIENLKTMMLRADVTDAEKYRRILEAYQIENDYGQTIEAYRADLKGTGTPRPVDFLRLGRVALYYQTLDGKETGTWNRVKKRWELLPDRYKKPIRNGLRMARKETAPDLLVLPVSAPEIAK